MARIGLSILLAAALLAAAYAPASADEGAGLTFGGNLTYGHAGCDGEGAACGDSFNGATGFDLHVGVMPIRKLAIVADGWVLNTDGGEGESSQRMISVGPRLWLLGGLYVGGGIGYARATFEAAPDLGPAMDVNQTGAAVMGNAGLEILSLGAVAVGLELRATRGLDQDDMNLESYTLGVGAQWR
jgi:opacity protein-like surface antigen